MTGNLVLAIILAIIALVFDFLIFCKIKLNGDDTPKKEDQNIRDGLLATAVTGFVIFLNFKLLS